MAAEKGISGSQLRIHLMLNHFSETVHYYTLLFLFTVLFVLQIWALLKIKRMLHRVLDIYRRMQEIAYSRQTHLLDNGLVQPSSSASVNYKRICQYCRHRETFLDPSGKNVFFYQCGWSKQKIKLNDFCSQFEFDPQRAEL
jgi:hypothetical protein